MRPPIVLLLLLLTVPVHAEVIHGYARVLDGDTLDVAGIRIRLHGIDAPEKRQHCRSAAGEWACGTEAARALTELIGNRQVECQALGHDRYRRTIGICRIDGGDVEAWMVGHGWALAYRRYSVDYVHEEDAARTAGLGIWSGTFEEPWLWRQRDRRAPMAVEAIDD